MAKQKTAAWTDLQILVGNAAGPEVFAEPCGVRSKNFERTKDMRENVVYDCIDPSAPQWVERDVRSFSAGFSGSGILDLDALDDWDTWAGSKLSRNCRVKMNRSLADNGRWYEGKFHLRRFNITGTDDAGKITFESDFTSDGEVTKIDVVA